MSLSLVTIWFGVIPDLEEDLISLVVSRIECYSSCNVLKMENLDAIECGVVGVFIAPTTKSGRWRAAVAWRTGQCQQAVGFWPLDLWQVGPLGCPVVHRTGPVDCPVCLLRVLWPLCAQARIKCVAVDRCTRSSCCSAGTPDSPVCTRHCPVLHQTVRWIIAERPPIFPKVESSASSSLVHRTLSGGTPDSPVRQTRVPFGMSFALFVWNLSWSFCWLIVNLWHL
jgi:hypothetical protein